MRESEYQPADAIIDEICAAGEPWTQIIKQGQIFRIVDLEGNQAVDTLFYNAHYAVERYSATQTICAQNNLYLTNGSKLYSNFGNVMLTIIADTCGRHDTLGGACAAESNTEELNMTKRDIPSNINFFMNVPVTESGELEFVDGISAPGKYVEMRAEMDVLVLISNCPQLNNPCNAYNPTPIRLLVWNGNNP